MENNAVVKTFEDANDLIKNIFLSEKTKSETKKMIIDDGFCIEEAINSENPKIRAYVVSKSFIPEDDFITLAKDEEYIVRAGAASSGRHPDMFLKDPHYLVRLEIAKLGLFHEVLYKDSRCEVRAEVARQGHYLEELSHDKKICVIYEVINQGYALEKFYKKNDSRVISACIKHNFRLYEIANDETRPRWVRLQVKEYLNESSLMED